MGGRILEFFNAFYDSHFYLPLALFVTSQDGVQRIHGAPSHRQHQATLAKLAESLTMEWVSM